MKIYKIFTSIKEAITKAITKLKQIKSKPITITEQKLFQIKSIIELITISILFIAGYKLLFNVNIEIAKYLLAFNLLFFANLYFYKLK